MQTLRACAVSMNGRLGEPEKVLGEIEGWTERAVERGAELILFPELVVHGHCTPNTWELAEPIPGGPSTERICRLAAKYKTVLSVGLSEKENDLVYNTQILAGPDGYLGKQRKIHLSRDEVFFYKGGRAIPVFDLGKCKVGTVVCYDNTFPELARILALRGADVLLMPHAARIRQWQDDPESERDARQASAKHYRQLMPCRARENACFAIAADQVGRAGYVDRYPKDSLAQPHHGGGAYVVDPEGTFLAQTQEQRIEPEMIFATLEASSLAKVRSDPNYTLRTRRPELFGELVAEQTTC